MDTFPITIRPPLPSLLETVKGLTPLLIASYFLGYLSYAPFWSFFFSFALFHFYQYAFVLWSYFTEGIPGPFPYPLLGNLFTTFKISDPPFAHLINDKWHKQYGPIYRTWSGRTSIIMINELKELRRILNTEYAKFDRRIEHLMFGPFLGNGILTHPNGEKWRQARALLTPAFHHLKLRELFPFIYTKSQKLAKRLSSYVPCERGVNIHEEFLKLTFDTICLVAFGSDFGALDSEYVKELAAFNFTLQHMQFRFYAPFPYWRYFKTKAVRRFEEEKQVLTQSIQKQIDLASDWVISKNTNKSSPGDLVERADVLSHILQMKYQTELAGKTTDSKAEEGGVNQDSKWVVSDSDIQDHLLNFIFAGHDTTANLLSWCIYYLARDQEKQEKVVEELGKVTSFVISGDDEKPFLYDHLAQCRYLECVVKEALRLRPSAPLRSRDIREGTIICGCNIKPESLLGWSPWAVHHNPQFWPDPEVFDPDRFQKTTTSSNEEGGETEGISATKLSPLVPTSLRSFAFIPFGSGPRRCLGAQLAVLEAKVVLATLLRKLRFTLATGQNDKTENSLTLHPAGGMWVCVHLRQSAK